MCEVNFNRTDRVVPLPTLATLANWRFLVVFFIYLFILKLNELQLSFVPILFALTRLIASSWGQRHRCTQCSWLVWKAGFWVSQTLKSPHQWWDHGHQPVKVQDQLEVCGPSEALRTKMRSFSHNNAKVTLIRRGITPTHPINHLTAPWWPPRTP